MHLLLAPGSYLQSPCTPVRADLVHADLVLDLVLSDLVLTDLVHADLVLDLVLTDLVLDLVHADLVLDLVLACLDLSYPDSLGNLHMHDLDILRSSDSEHSSLGPLNHP